MDMLTQALVLTAQGIPFIHGGEEFLRSKGGHDNSYAAGDAVNQFDWELKARHRNVFDYYAELIRLRKNHPAFRMTSADDIHTHLSFTDGPAGTLILKLNDHPNGDSWKNILVIYNPTQSAHTILLPAGNWMVVGLQGKIDEQSVREVVGIITVASISCTILYQAGE
jgi:pullulanase